MKQLFDEIIRQFEQAAHEIEQFINTDRFNSELFDEPIIIAGVQSGRGSMVYGRHGIYLFVFKEDVTLSWEDTARWGKLKSSGFKTWGNKDIKKGECLYLGSCVSSSLYTRMNQHFGNNLTYSGLHLENENRIFLKDKVQCFAFPIVYCHDEIQFSGK